MLLAILITAVMLVIVATVCSLFILLDLWVRFGVLRPDPKIIQAWIQDQCKRR